MKYQHIAGLAALLAIVAVPALAVHAQSSATTRAQEILNRNADRQADIAGREAERLQEFDALFQNTYENRLIPQVDAASADMRATIIPITTQLDNIGIRLNNIEVVLAENNIPLELTAATGNGVVAYNVGQKLENFWGCYNGTTDGTTGAGTCIVYNIPANSVEQNPAGLQKLVNHPASADMAFTDWLEGLSPTGAPIPAAWGLAGDGYATGQTDSEPEFDGQAFILDYTELREDATNQAGSLTKPQYGITQSMLDVMPTWDPVIDCGVVGTTVDCEFTSPETFNMAVQVQLAKLRNHTALLSGSLTNVQQAVRAYVHDVLEALENYQKNVAPYDPTGGEDPYNPSGRQGEL